MFPVSTCSGLSRTTAGGAGCRLDTDAATARSSSDDTLPVVVSCCIAPDSGLWGLLLPRSGPIKTSHAALKTPAAAAAPLWQQAERGVWADLVWMRWMRSR